MASGLSPTKGSLRALAAERRSSQSSNPSKPDDGKGSAHYVVSRVPSLPSDLAHIPVTRPTRLDIDAGARSESLNLTSPRSKPTFQRAHSQEQAVRENRPGYQRTYSISSAHPSVKEVPEFDIEKMRRLVYIATFAPQYLPILELSRRLEMMGLKGR
ncbi:MAG TPA: hypothetical protein VLG44_06675 [Chlamydiales bacterium]|nr:hypothetical protein [Chlamydiales bacterium]